MKYFKLQEEQVKFPPSPYKLLHHLLHTPQLLIHTVHNTASILKRKPSRKIAHNQDSETMYKAIRDVPGYKYLLCVSYRR